MLDMDLDTMDALGYGPMWHAQLLAAFVAKQKSHNKEKELRVEFSCAHKKPGPKPKKRVGMRKLCKACNKMYTMKRLHQTHCSPKCRLAVNAKRRKVKNANA